MSTLLTPRTSRIFNFNFARLSITGGEASVMGIDLRDALLLAFGGLLVSSCTQLHVVLFADGFDLHMLFHSFQDNEIYALLGLDMVTTLRNAVN